jgi:hypothetical protein
LLEKCSLKRDLFVVPVIDKNISSTETEEMTVSEYDMSQVKKALQQVLIGAVMVSFIHYKWGIVQPLFLQSIMGPMGLYKNPVRTHHHPNSFCIQMFKIFVLKETVARPFKEESPFANLYAFTFYRI